MQRNIILSALLIVSTACMAVPVENTAGVAPIQSDSSRVYDIDEIVVIAQPKEVLRLRQQPLSASSFDNTQLYSIGIQDIRELSAFVPSFTMPNYGSRYTSSAYVRGIGSRVNSPAIGVYVDGMPIQSKSAFNFHTYDIDRVDVLRGPQGTLYGMNTEGGLLRIYSKNPMNYQGTDVTLSVGSRFWRKAEVSHYHKISDKVAFSLSGFYDGQNGFQRNSFNGHRADNFDEAGGKMRLVFAPSKRLTMSMFTDYQFVHQNGFPYGVYSLSTGSTASPNTNTQGRYHRNIFNGAFDINYKGAIFDFSSITSYQYLNDRMLMDIDYSALNAMEMEQRQLKNGFTQEFMLKSNRKQRWQWTFGAFGSFDWLKTNAPIHFYEESFTSTVAQSIQSSMYNAMLNSMAARMIQTAPMMTMEQARAAAAVAIERAGGVTMDCTLDIPGMFRTPMYNMAVFHESNISITDRLTATLGLRYDYSHSKIEFDTHAQMDFIANVMGTEANYAFTSFLQNKYTKGFDQLLPKIGLTYQLDRLGSNAYAVVSKGYRAGGYNIQSLGDYLRAELEVPEYRNQAMRGDFDVPHDAESYAQLADVISFKPEESWNFEAGTHLNLFNNTMHFDFAAYYMRIKNQQLSVMASRYGFGRMMVNAGKSFSCGIETTLRGRALNNHLEYSLTYSFTHAAFKEYVDEIADADGNMQVVNYKDNKIPFVPAHQLAAIIDYEIPISNSGLTSITFGPQLNGQGRTYWDEANIAYNNFYVVLGAHADMFFKINKLDFDLNFWGRNLTNTHYNTFVFASTDPGQTYFGQRGNTIQFGADLKIHF